MKIVIALDKFKGTLSAPQACEIVRDAFLEVRRDWDLVVKPMADGGDGTAQASIAARGGEWVKQKVRDPLGREIESGFGWFEKDHSAIVEMAAASGIALLRSDELNPLKATTFGTGQLIQAAIQRGAIRIWLAVGGSATVDGGSGAAMALGWRFLDDEGMRVGQGGGELKRIAKIEAPGNLRLPEIEVLCDVDNPLGGEQGAAHVFGPQKGATPEMVEQLNAGLRHLAELVKAQLGKDIADVPGAGAAGGLAFGAMAFMGAKLVPGIDTVMEVSGLDEALRGADWVITGEGKFDEQSLRGKVVAGVTRLAKKHRVRVAVLAGSVNLPKHDSIEFALATQKKEMPLDVALANARPLLAEAARELAGKLGDRG